MIKDDRILYEVRIAIESLSAIELVYSRDGFISPKYLLEKTENAKFVCSWLEYLAKGEDDD